MCECVYIWCEGECVCVFVWCECMCMCMVWMCVLITLFRGQALSRDLEVTDLARWAGQRSLDSPCLVLQCWNFWIQAPTLSFLCGHCRFKIMSSNSHDKPFTSELFLHPSGSHCTIVHTPSLPFLGGLEGRLCLLQLQQTGQDGA